MSLPALEKIILSMSGFNQGFGTLNFRRQSPGSEDGLPLRSWAVKNT